MVALSARAAHADEEAPKSVTHEYSSYERETIDAALADTHREVDPSPEGKIVEGYDVVTLDVFEERDPVPRVFNVFHWTSKPYTISRELLVDVGEPYRKVLVDESARNLRKQSAQLSLVLLVPVKGSKPNTVRVLLITKDVWSLRLNMDFRFVPQVERLFIQPSEQNVFGTHHVAAVQFLLEPLDYAVGGYYQIPWVAGTRVQAAAEANVVVNRDTRQAEGSFGTLDVGYPLYSTRTPWAADVAYQWRHDVYRRYTNAELAQFAGRDAQSPGTIPWQYHRTVDYARAYAIRSYGWRTKFDVTFGGEARRGDYHTLDVAGADPVRVAEFVRRVLPQSDTRVGPILQLRSYRTDYARLLDVETLALQEDVRLGHDVLAKIYPSFTALGATRTFVGLDTRGQYTLPLGDGFVRGMMQGLFEIASDHVDQSTIETQLRIMSPRIALGRFVYDLDFTRRFRNYYNDTDTFGGESRPRGYPTRFLFGPNSFAQTLEVRSRPIEILKTQWSSVAFWDVGAAYETTRDMNLYHSVGFGLRALFPQFDRIAYRLDVGVPLGRNLPSSVGRIGVVLTVDQAFPLPNVIDPARTLE